MSARTIVRLMGVQRAQRTESYSTWVTDEYLDRCEQINTINVEFVKNVKERNRERERRKIVAPLRIVLQKLNYMLYTIIIVQD